MESDKQLTFIQDIAKMEFDPEVFKNQIRLFSQYLAYSNENYKYNETYLDSFCREFLRFKKYVKLKNKVFGKLCQYILGSASNLDLVLIIDQFWVISTTNGEITTKKAINERKVCSNQIQIKAKLQFAQKDYLFFREYKVIQRERLLKKCVEQICIDFMDWTEGITNESGNKKN